VIVIDQAGSEDAPPARLGRVGRAAEVEEARREVAARSDEQRRREEEEWERRRRLADRRAALSDEALAGLRHRAEGALAADGVGRTRLGYEVLVKLKMDEFLEREYLPTVGGDDRTPAERAAVACGKAEIAPGSGGGHLAR
jgi:hypothetical protein